MATATITITDGELEDEVRISVHYNVAFDPNSAAHELVTEILADLNEPQSWSDQCPNTPN
jgi:hypothetical protein